MVRVLCLERPEPTLNDLTPLPKPRILVVEDHWLVALEAELLLEEAGCEVVGPAATLEEALTLAREAALSGALLDIELGARNSMPVAQVLAARGVPFAFATGHAQEFLPEACRGRPYLDKPCTHAAIRRFLGTLGRAVR